MSIFSNFKDLDKECIKEIKKWIRITILATGFPILCTVCAGMASEISFYQLVGNGDIILSLFALLMAMFNSVFEEKRHQDEQMSNAYWYCLSILFLQLLNFFCIKEVIYNCPTRDYPHKWFFWNMSEENDYYIIFFVLTVALFILTIMTCIYSIKAIYKHKEAKGNE